MGKGIYKIKSNKNGKKVLVICNYKWYKPYKWHLGQLEKENINSTITCINFKELNLSKNKIFDLIRKIHLTISECNNSEIIIFDGFIGVFLLLPTFFLKNKYLIAATQNYAFPNLSFQSILKYLFLKKFFEKCNLIILASHQNKEIINSFLSKTIKDKIKVFYPTINFESKKNYLVPTEEVGTYLLSCGETNRDYEILSKSLNYYEKEVRISCPLNTFKKIKFNSNVKYEEITNTSSYINIIRKSKFLVITLDDDLTSSGLRIIFWGMELAKPIIVSQTSFLSEVFGNDSPLIFVERNSKDSLIKAINKLDSDIEMIKKIGNKSRKWSEENLTSKLFINNFWKENILSL